VEQLRASVAPFGYAVDTVSTSGCLHLKSAVTAIDERTVLINPRWVSRQPFQEYRQIDSDPSEPGAANVVSVGGQVIAAASFPRTCAHLEEQGVRVTRVDASELAKAEGALTCCSVLVS
jgi:dimethylargininase